MSKILSIVLSCIISWYRGFQSNLWWDLSFCGVCLSPFICDSVHLGFLFLFVSLASRLLIMFFKSEKVSHVQYKDKQFKQNTHHNISSEPPLKLWPAYFPLQKQNKLNINSIILNMSLQLCFVIYNFVLYILHNLK